MWGVPVLAKGALPVGGASLTQRCVACAGGPVLAKGALHVGQGESKPPLGGACLEGLLHGGCIYMLGDQRARRITEARSTVSRGRHP